MPEQECPQPEEQPDNIPEPVDNIPEPEPAETETVSAPVADERPQTPAQEAEAPSETVVTDVSLEANHDASSLWQKLILDVTDCLKKSMLGAVMGDALPETIRDSVLYVAFDSQYGQLQKQQTENELALLTGRLRAVSGDPAAELRIGSRPGYRVNTPLRGVDEQAQTNPTM